MTDTSPVQQTLGAAGASDVLERFWTETVQRVNRELDRLIPAADCDPARLHAAMRHAITAGGKRLRPVLCAAVHSAVGGSDERIFPVAAAIEMLHTYSLIHDDLPCMDDDDQRRGQPTVHVAFDEATAVLAGDALHVLAFEVLAQEGTPAISALIARAIGTSGMLGGQMADLEAEGTQPTEELVAAIHRRKTGALLVASAQAGALLAGVPDATTESIGAYARPLGLAFQIIDDVLEVTGDERSLGKSTSSDQKHQKVTYPGAVGVERARQRARELADEATRTLADLKGNTEILHALAEFVIRRDR